MRSTQFDEHSPFEEKPEEHHPREQPDTLCESLKRLGYARNNQVTLYGEVFALVSDPIRIGDDCVLLDVLEARLQCLRDLSIECGTADDQGITAGKMRRPPEAPSAKRWCW